MRFLPDQDHRTYAATVRRLLADAEPVRAARAWAAGDQGPGRELWRALADTGLPALAVPEERGGLGWYPPELASAFVEIGRAGAPGPLVETVALAAALGHDPGGSGGATAGPWLPRVLTGDLLVTVADPAAPAGGPHAGPPAGADAGTPAGADAGPSAGAYAVDAHLADAVFVTAGDALHLAVPEGEPLASIDPTRHLVRCAPVTPVASGEPVPGDGARLRALATLLTAAQALGTGRALLEGSVEYVGQRTQFGRPIGSFQAVKHHLATVAVALEFAEPLLRGAALAVRGDAEGAEGGEGGESGEGGEGGAADPRDLPAAKAACCHAAHRAARTALQVHGALGYTDEYDLTLPLRKARALHDAWGTPAACRAAVLAGGEPPS